VSIVGAGFARVLASMPQYELAVDETRAEFDALSDAELAQCMRNLERLNSDAIRMLAMCHGIQAKRSMPQ
jgi:hypothetical protein